MGEESRIVGGSAMARLIRERDWSGNSLGEIASWPDDLVTMVNQILAAPLPMQLFWGEEFLCLYNDAMKPLLFDKHPGALGEPARVVWREAWETIGPQMEQVMRTGEAVFFENALVPLVREGTLEDRYWTYSYSPVFDRTGKIVGVLDIAQDTTKLWHAEKAEDARRASEQRLADFTVATNDALYQMSADWKIMSQLDGHSFLADTTTADSHWLEKYIHPLDQPVVRAEIERAIRTKTKFELEHRVLLADGSRGWTFSRAIPTLNEQGEILYWLGAARDITDRKRDEEEIRHGRTQLLLALEAASLASWYYDPLRNVVGGDALMGKLFGLEIPEGPAEIWLEAVMKEDRARVGKEFSAALEGAPYDTEYRVCVENKTRWLRARARIVEETGAGRRMLGICEDITERKMSEKRLRETVERLALAEQVGNMAAWEWDLHSNTFLWDPAGAWVYGRPPAELSQLEAIQAHIHKDDLKHVMENIKPAVSGEGEFNTEFRVCWPDGTNHWLIGKGRPILNEEGKVVRVNGVNIDITERRTAELALRQSEKLAAVGQLASTISHEINNPLESVTNLLYLAKHGSTDPEVTQYLSTAEVELRRVSAITSQTLQFHKQQSAPSEVSCTDLFTNALMIFQGRIENAGIQVERRTRAQRLVACFEGEVRQVMNNLIGNAIDAMKQGGRLLVRSAEATDWRTGRKGLRLTVADTGSGMSKKTLSQLFQAFYTTKGINGTGLGLWVSHEIVQRHNGRLSVRSCDVPARSGTVFHLFLPFDSETVSAAGQVF